MNLNDDSVQNKKNILRQSRISQVTSLKSIQRLVNNLREMLKSFEDQGLSKEGLKVLKGYHARKLIDKTSMKIISSFLIKKINLINTFMEKCIQRQVASGFIHFCHNERRQILKKWRGAHRNLGIKWANLSNIEKEKFLQKHKTTRHATSGKSFNPFIEFCKHKRSKILPKWRSCHRNLGMKWMKLSHDKKYDYKRKAIINKFKINKAKVLHLIEDTVEQLEEALHLLQTSRLASHATHYDEPESNDKLTHQNLNEFLPDPEPSRNINLLSRRPGGQVSFDNEFPNKYEDEVSDDDSGCDCDKCRQYIIKSHWKDDQICLLEDLSRREDTDSTYQYRPLIGIQCRSCSKYV